MKKLTKLINGSVVVFVICLMIVLTLTSCIKTDTKMCYTSPTEIQGDEDNLTEEKFIYAVDLNNFDNFEIKFYTNNMTIKIEVSNHIITYYDEQGNQLGKEEKSFKGRFKSIIVGEANENEVFKVLEYNKDDRCYYGTLEFESNSFSYKYKFKNNKLILGENEQGKFEIFYN